MSKVCVNEALEAIRVSMNLTEVDIQNDAERLFSIASENKIGNKIMANVPLYLIYIDDSYQRTETFSKEKANGIAANFIEAAYDPIKLNYRDGRFLLSCRTAQNLCSYVLWAENLLVLNFLLEIRKRKLISFLHRTITEAN